MALEDDDVGYALTAPGQEEWVKGHNIHIPSNYKEAMNFPQKAKWQEAMEHQFDKLVAKGTCVLRNLSVSPRLIYIYIEFRDSAAWG